MKNLILQTIKPLDYNLALSQLKGSAEATKILETLIADHKAMLEIREYLIKQQFLTAAGIFAFGNPHDSIKASDTDSDNPSVVSFTNTEKNVDSVHADFANDQNNSTDDLDENEPESIKPEEKSDTENSQARGKKPLPLGVVKFWKLKESDKECGCCGQRMHMQRTKSKTIVIARPLFTTETHKSESCRCLQCNTSRDAETPAEIQQTFGRYHYSAVANMAALRYQFGMASYRLEQYSTNVGLKISDSTQWMLFENAASYLIKFDKFLVDTAANAPTKQVDDTHALILAVAKSIEEEQNIARNNGQNPDDVRSGIHTTNLTAVFEEGTVVLFRTGLHHAGEALARVLEARTVEDEIIIMADASSANTSKLHTVKAKVKVANCNSHVVRKFKDLAKSEKEIADKLNIPEPEPNPKLDFFLEKYKKLFILDKQTRGMNAEQRLEFHKFNSAPLMESMLKQIDKDLRQKRVEPNSDLGGIYKYFKKHYPELSAFCHTKNAPICNNLAERMLKAIIRQRKNSLFYRNQLGARVADILTSILLTAHANEINSIEYLT